MNKYYRLIRTKTITEHCIVRAGNKSDAKLLAEDDYPGKNVFISYSDTDKDWEIVGSNNDSIIEDSALNCAEYFKDRDKLND